jgi:hypothetical protein
VLILDPGLVVRRFWVSPDWLARTEAAEILAALPKRPAPPPEIVLPCLRRPLFIKAGAAFVRSRGDRRWLSGRSLCLLRALSATGGTRPSCKVKQGFPR